MMFQRYWMVHNVSQNHPPCVRHASKTQARKEAKRLAEANPGVAFAVLEVVDAFLLPTTVGAIRLELSSVAEPSHTAGSF